MTREMEYDKEGKCYPMCQGSGVYNFAVQKISVLVNLAYLF